VLQDYHEIINLILNNYKQFKWLGKNNKNKNKKDNLLGITSHPEYWLIIF